MQDSSTITTRQLYYLFILSIIPINVLYIPGEPVSVANQDAWLAVILAAFAAGALVYYPLADMGSRFRGLTVIQYSENVAGKYLGKIFSVLILYFYFELHCWTLREITGFSSIIFPKTPDLILMVMISIASVYAAAKGLRLIGRIGDCLFPLGLMIFISLALLGISEADFKNLLPLFTASPGSMFRAAIVALDWLTVGLTFGVLTAFADKPERLKTISVYATASTGLIIVCFSILIIAVFGTELVKMFSYPLLMFARNIGIGMVFERIEALLVAGWLAWLFMAAVITSYVSVLGIAQLFRLSDYRFLILPETVLAIAYSTYQYKSYIEQTYLFSVAHLYYLIFAFAVPLLLWIIYLVRFRILKAYELPNQLPH